MKSKIVFLLLFAGSLLAVSPEHLADSVHRDLSCDSCHAGGGPPERILKQDVPATCGQCHPAVLEEYRQSVHGKAVAGGVADAPVCTDCHGEHGVLPHLEKLSQVYPTNIAKTTCPQCHASERIIAKYNLPGNRVESFKDTYHGLAAELGDVRVANCASCHGVHNILASSDPASSIHPDRLAETCGKCHPNATENFTKGSVHGYAERNLSGRVIRFVKRFYAVLIAVVIGGLLLHNLLDYCKKLKAAYRRRSAEPSFARMNRNERIQHAVLFASFFVLVATGFALKFGWPLPSRSLIHRIAGVLLLTDLVYHLIYMLATARGRQMLRDFGPRWRDFAEAGGYLGHLLGRASPPRFGRFTYWEKLEYWSVVWGTLIMGGTGLLLWFENWSLGFLPKWGLDVATLIHFLEAILATLAILVGHLYFVILNPDLFPMSFTWLNGRIPRDHALKEHPAEYEGRETGKEGD